MKMLTEQISARLEVLRNPPGGGDLLRFRGTALVQGGLSRNGRYYPPDVVREAMERARTTPLTVYARHRDAVEGSGLPVGRVDRVYLDGPNLKYEATLAPTRLGRDLRVLIEGGFLIGASIRAWPYTSHAVRLGGRDVEWVDSLTLRGIDFTDEPGVPEAAGFEILEEALKPEARGARSADPAIASLTEAAPPLEETTMDLRSLDLETLRTQRPDLLEAARTGESAILEEVRRIVGVPHAGALPQAVRDLVRLRVRQEITDLVRGEMGDDPAQPAILARLLEECHTVAEARERLARERAYAAELRRAHLAPGTGARLHPAGCGLVDNADDHLSPDQARVRRLAGL